MGICGVLVVGGEGVEGREGRTTVRISRTRQKLKNMPNNILAMWC
jgi:hypothetical protein